MQGLGAQAELRTQSFVKHQGPGRSDRSWFDKGEQGVARGAGRSAPFRVCGEQGSVVLREGWKRWNMGGHGGECTARGAQGKGAA